MARSYSALYNSQKPDSDGYIKPHLDGNWSVIFKDDEEDYWAVHLSNAEDQDTAKELADALNLLEKKKSDDTFLYQ